MQFRRYLSKGTANVLAESTLLVMARNVKKLPLHEFSFVKVTVPFFLLSHPCIILFQMLSLENRESKDNPSLGKLFLYFSDEMSDITWIQTFQMLLQRFRNMLTENTELSDEKCEQLVDAFMNALPVRLKTKKSKMFMPG